MAPKHKNRSILTVKNKNRLGGILTVFLSVFAGGLHAAPEQAEALYSRALEKISASEAGPALEFLDRALEIEPEHGKALLARAGLYLELGLWRDARRDFRQASFHADPRISSAAHIGLGHVYRILPFRKLQAVAQYRLALRADPANREALYALAETGFALEETQGYRMAARTLVRLICIDPGYRDAYRQWRDRILDQTDDELREAGACIETWLETRPDTAFWRLDLARDRFRLGELEQALATLETIDRADSTSRLTERRLLLARCLLELGDTLGFESSYARALGAAGSAEDLRCVLAEAETIFTPQESEAYEKLKSMEQMRAFWRKFWLARDPDPLTFHNERLVTHYLRLHQARKLYRMNFPHSRFQTSRDYFRLVSPVSYLYEYDPDIFFNRSRSLTIDQRGLMFIRHGPPERMTRQVTWSNPMEIWYYGSVHFLFEKRFGAGDFVFVPSVTSGAGDIMQAMQGETYKDPLPACEQDFYVADFLAPEGRIEIEFYQSAQSTDSALAAGVEATLGVFDTSWAGVALDRRDATRVYTGRDTCWLAVNRVTAEPGDYLYALRMAILQHRALVRGRLELAPYRTGILELSGIVLGSSSAGGEPAVHQRRGVSLLPRPSLEFSPGETIEVYLEIYGLQARPPQERSFREWVTVSRAGEGNKGFWRGLKRLLGLRGSSGRTSLTLRFDRRAESPAGTVTENFTIDTSNLAPGPYRVLVEVRDNSNGRRNSRALEFELREKEKGR